MLPQVFKNIPNIDVSLSLSGHILASMGGFSVDFVRYFASFPRDISQLSLVPNELIVALANFLQYLPSRYSATQATLQQRGFSISPRECWSAFAPITAPCSRLLHLHFLSTVFLLSQLDVMESLDQMFVECQNSLLAHINQPGPTAAAQSRFETMSRSIMHKAMIEHGSGLVRPSVVPVPHIPQQLLVRRATMQDSMMQQPVRQTPANQHYASPHPLPTVPSTQQPTIQRPASSTGSFSSYIQNQPAHVQPRPGHPAQRRMRPPLAGHRTNRSDSTTFYPQPSPQQLQPIPPTSGPAPVYPSLFARPGDLPSLPADAHPEVYAIHQSHLTNKVMKLVDYYTNPEHTLPLYQIVNELSLGPNQLRFSTDTPVHSFTFEVSEDQFSHRPAEKVMSDFQPSQWRVNREVRLFRFRCAKHVPQDGSAAQKKWMVTPTFWPLNCYFNCNGHIMEPRRSNQWHKNLPIDLMPFLKAGKNTIDIFINKLPNQKVEAFVGAVECIKLSTADDIIKDVSGRVMKAEELIKSLALKSKSSAENDDDELSIVSESVQVSIYDPIMGSGICKTPVRSGHCKHKECFDLETFLQSRLKRPENDVYEADNWVCPICKAYSAPSVLYIDGYFVDVRNELIKTGRTDARSIVINKDGTWLVKEESKEDERQSGMDDPEQEPIEIIQLD